jgi:hypothetical protein
MKICLNLYFLVHSRKVINCVYFHSRIKTILNILGTFIECFCLVKQTSHSFWVKFPLKNTMINNGAFPIVICQKVLSEFLCSSWLWRSAVSLVLESQRTERLCNFVVVVSKVRSQLPAFVSCTLVASLTACYFSGRWVEKWPTHLRLNQCSPEIF